MPYERGLEADLLLGKTKKKNKQINKEPVNNRKIQINRKERQISVPTLKRKQVKRGETVAEVGGSERRAANV